MNPDHYLIRMLGFLAAALVLALVLIVSITHFFLVNPALNALIFGVLLIGIVYLLRQVLQLRPEAQWFDRFRRQEPGLAVAPAPNLLGPIAAAFGDGRKRVTINASTGRALVDGLAARLDEGRETSRYLVSLLIFLGLLGTFWGLLQTVGSIGQAIRDLSVTGGDFSAMFGDLKKGLEAPLSGMGTAFSTSLFGLAGSLVLGFLELQAGQAQGRFLLAVEDWLSSVTKIGGGGPSLEAEGSVPAYLTALLENTAENLDKLQRTLARAEEGRATANEVLGGLTERMAVLIEHIRHGQDQIGRIADAQGELRPLLQRLAQQPIGLDESSRSHLRSLDATMGRLLDGQANGFEEVAGQVKILTRTITAIVSEAK